MLPRREGLDVVSWVGCWVVVSVDLVVSVVTGVSIVTGVSVVVDVSGIVDVSVVISASVVNETSINFDPWSKQTTPAAWSLESQGDVSKWLHSSKLDSCPEQIISW